MKLKTITLIICCIFINLAIGQEEQDTLVTINKKDYPELSHKKTVYSMLQKAWVANQSVSYLSPTPHVNSVGDRRIPLREGENRSSNFYLMEANINI